MQRGSRYSTIYTLNTIVFASYAFHGMVMLIGIFNYTAFYIGMCSSCFLCCCCGFPVLFVTAILRFNTKGSLAALSQSGSEFKEVAVHVGPTNITSSKRTFEIDAKYIFVLWILQIFVVLCQCCWPCYMNSYITSKQKRGNSDNKNGGGQRESDYDGKTELGGPKDATWPYRYQKRHRPQSS